MRSRWCTETRRTKMSDTNFSSDGYDKAAAALAHLCDDFGELEVLAHLLRTFPASYGASSRLVARLAEVSSRLWDIHDGPEGVK